MTTIAEMLKRLAQARDRSEFNNRLRGFEVFNSRVGNMEVIDSLTDLKTIASIGKEKKRTVSRRFLNRRLV